MGGRVRGGDASGWRCRGTTEDLQHTTSYGYVILNQKNYYIPAS